MHRNKHFTLEGNPLRREDLDGFVELYEPEDHAAREPTWSEEDPDGRWRAYDADLITTDDDFDHLDPKFIRCTKVGADTGDVLE